ncbi:hypothetical protein [Streptomyces filipinensis]|uniref:hypothetical protein n=1 Tax=Streptomyces filipinensis TaxID=66887 RepID=UPI001E5AE153|nr:hypothetical protein [Streptomyces filipinensis]
MRDLAVELAEDLVDARSGSGNGARQRAVLAHRDSGLEAVADRLRDWAEELRRR